MDKKTKVKLILDKHNKENNNCLAILAYDHEKYKTIIDAMTEAFELGEDSLKEKAIKAIEKTSADNELINADDSFQAAYEESIEVIKKL